MPRADHNDIKPLHRRTVWGMRFEVALFAYQREKHGAVVYVESGPTVKGVLNALEEFGIPVGHCRLAVDETMASGDENLCETSRLALIPPVSGG
jgi:molybdopterin converting factor small subunit